jgi:hypothetical protein
MMKANPGAIVSPSEVIGRDRLITNLWERLEQQSLILSAERRMGKTSVIKKMQAEAPKNKLPIYHDLSGVRTSLEFVEVVLQDVEEYLSGLNRTAKKARELLRQLSETEIMSLKLPKFAAPHWKNILTKTIADLVENQDRQVILLWDEVPYMLTNMEDGVAMEVLDMLRSLRQMYSKVRMVFTGSIGLHHVVASLKKKGYSGAPTNDMYSVDLPPLSQADATELALRLLEGENINTINPQETAENIAQNVNCIPFYIHHLILKLKTRGNFVDVETIPELIDECLLDHLNPWQIQHYQERIDSYYDDEQRFYAFNLLDILATSEQPLFLNELLNRLSLQPEFSSHEKTRKILRLLEQDYYIIRQKDLKYCFRYSLIQRYWQILRA